MALVTIVIPCFQERGFIQSCLMSVQQFDLPPDTTVEVLVVDGMSTDGTREIVQKISETDRRFRLVDNPQRIQSSGLNIGIRSSRGSFVMRLDAHSQYPQNYLAVTVETALRTGADNVGGVCTTEARGPGYGAAIVQALTTHRFGVGDSSFRVAAKEGEADTVPYGCFPRDLFDRIGLFDERLVRCQDYEFNRRIQKCGGRVWLNPAIRVHYFQQPTLAAFLRKQFVLEAPYNPYMWFVAPYSFALRHAVTGLFAFATVAGLVLLPFSRSVRALFFGVAAVYTLLAITSAAQQAWRYKKRLHLATLPVAFFLYHFSHGLGVLAGVIRLALGLAPIQRGSEPWAGAGRFRAIGAPTL